MSQARVKVGDKELEVSVLVGTEDEIGLDIKALRSSTGAVTLDPGYMNTASCTSGITFLDGEKGILRYRGYPIEELAERSTFLEVAYLLIYGELPMAGEYQAWVHDITQHTMLHEDVRHLFRAFPKRAHPMAVSTAVVAALSAFYQEDLKSEQQEDLHLNLVRLLAKFPTIAACSYKHSLGQPANYPRNHLDYTSRFVDMMFSVPCEPYEVNPTVARALDLLLVLHADHEQNCSTSTVRLVGSSLANLFASISAGISALWGRLHGGANQAVIEMLESIRASGGDVEGYVDKVKEKESGIRLMGFGHRVYKNHDPRARIIKRACTDVLEALGSQSQLLDIAMRLEEVALSDPYFVERKLYPNVDFYSGIIYQAMGIPANMFTTLFAMGRLPGWIAHWREMRSSSDFKIGRPRQIYTGAKTRSYVPIEER